MITHEIVKYIRPRKVKPHPTTKIKTVGDNQHLRDIHQRCIAKTRWKIGDVVQLHGRTRAKGTIIDIITEFNNVEWDGFKCLYIEVAFDVDHTELFHWNDFTKRGRMK